MENMIINVETLDGSQPANNISICAQLILKEAEHHGVKWERAKYTGVFKLNLGDHTEYFHRRIPSKTTSCGVHCCDQKDVSRHLLSQAGLSVPQGYSLRPTDEKKYWLEVFRALKKPLVVKPYNASLGKGVYLSLDDEAEYCDVVAKVFKEFGGKPDFFVLVEEMFPGKEYRILVSRKKVIGVIERIPANVVGDGTSTINELIVKKNDHPLRLDKEYSLKPIIIDEEVLNNLKEINLTLTDILPQGQQVFLRKSTLLTIDNGGDTIDVTDTVHSSVKQIALTAIRAMPGLSWAGLDFMTNDITKPQQQDSYRIIEINSSPCLDWQEFPYVGKRRRVALEFLKIMFPEIAAKTDRPFIPTAKVRPSLPIGISSQL